jgi:hypothetical protein
MDMNKLINIPVQELGLSEEFSKNADSMGYRTIQEIIDARPEELSANKDFSYTWLGELSEFMMKHDILHLLQPATGKSYD